jgi:hypothetical protein
VICENIPKSHEHTNQPGMSAYYTLELLACFFFFFFFCDFLSKPDETMPTECAIVDSNEGQGRKEGDE